ncbi:molecular chaperone [Citrobacter braakii]|uniref:fimbrial biogenesis chaperone n=1 Tax=Citrobacter braakii TaxID=57706 RepID=UPI0019045ED7|nr:molecular chaperone [Citrobacter braakii]MBJ8896350.1 molecular chaperone [Citrobacter braakii]
MKKLLWVLTTLLLFPYHANCGVVVGGTRFIFPQEDKTLVVALRNTEKEPFLVQSKIVSDNGFSTSGQLSPTTEPQKSPFIATPPLVVVNGGDEQQIKIIYVDDSLPGDRESLFWLSVAAIPPTDSSEGLVSPVKIAVSQQIKILWRPTGIPTTPVSKRKPLTWQRHNKRVTVSNDSPWYVTLSALQINGKMYQGGMVPPFSQRANDWCPEKGKCEISWQKLGDRGEVIQRMNMSL